MKKELTALSKAIFAIIEADAPNCKTKELVHSSHDGAVCDKRHHKILFKDDIIRVMDVSVAPKQDEIFHRHERCALMYVDKPASIEYYDNVDNPSTYSWKSDNLTPRFNVIPSEGMHRVKNVDERAFQAFRVEINQDIVALANFKALSDKLLELIKSRKEVFDKIRDNPTSLLNLYSLSKMKHRIRQSEVKELQLESARFTGRPFP